MATAAPLSDVPRDSGLQAVPGDSGPPLVGYTFSFMKDPVTMLRQRYDHYGPVSWTQLFGIRMVKLLGPEANEFVFKNKGNL